MEHGIENSIIASDEDEGTVTIEVSVTKEGKDVINEIKGLINEHDED